MRVESERYTKNHLSAIIEVPKPRVQEREGDFMEKKADDLKHTKWMGKYHIGLHTKV